MENKLLLPVQYCPMNEEEMSYTSGGDTTINVNQILMYTASAVLGAVSIYNYIWGLNGTRNWIKKNKDQDVTKVLEAAVNDTTAYLTSSLFNCVRGILTAMQLTSLFPITAVGWLTAL